MKNLIIPIALTLLLTACVEKVDTPRQITQKYWDAIKTGDAATARNLVSKNSQRHLNAYLALTPEQKTVINKINLAEAKTTVTTTINPESTNPVEQHEVETTLILENGQWKIDAAHTPFPMTPTSSEDELEELAQQLSESMHKNMETMDDAVTEGLDLLNEALEDGSKEMGESLLRGMNEMNEALRESIDKMKKRRKEHQNIDESTGEGMI